MKSIVLTLALAAACSSLTAQNLSWAKQIGGTDEDRALAVFTDNQGTLYVGGHYKGHVDFDPGPDSSFRDAPRGEAYILKLDASGNFAGVLTFGHTSGSYSCTVNAMRKDASGNLYVSGYFNGTVDFDPDTAIVQSVYVSGKHGFLLKLDASEKYHWVKYWRYNKDAGETSEPGPSCIWDASGNYYATGSYSGETDFDPGTAKYELTSKANDAYILKLDSNGDFIWAKQLLTDSAIQTVEPSSISLDAAGNTYIAGTFRGTVDFDPDSSAEFKLSAGITYGFLLKLDVNGNFVWAKPIGSTGDPFYDSHTCRAVSTDANGNSYITGSFSNTVTLGSTQITSAGLSDIFVAKADASGNFVWAKQIGSFYDAEEGQEITQDASGNIYIAGIYRGTTNFHTSGGIANLTSNGSVDNFILKLAPDGNFIYALGLGGSNPYERIYNLSPSGNSIYTVGRFIENLNCDPNGSYYMNSAYSGTGNHHYDGFLIKLTEDLSGLPSLETVDVSVFPNPAKEIVTVQLSKNSAQAVTIELYDVPGKRICTLETGQSIAQLKLNGLSSGLYFLKIQVDKQTITKRLLVE